KPVLIPKPLSPIFNSVKTENGWRLITAHSAGPLATIIDMKRYSWLVILIFPLSIGNAYSQSVNLNEFSHPCDSISTKDLATINIGNREVEYRILLKEKAYYNTKRNRIVFRGEVLIPNLSKDIDSIGVRQIMTAIGIANDIDELIGFRDCAAQRIFYQAMKYLPGQKEHLEKNLIGLFIIEK
ncbi:MAG: hypothetical protein ABFS32_19765, partial [Bacteroidota bacterium]